MGEIRQQIDKAMLDATSTPRGPAQTAGLMGPIQGLIAAVQILADRLDAIQDGRRTS
jgi:hypothetical protein